MNQIPGNYECHLYDNTVNKNDSHYVNINQVDRRTFRWTNRAGVSWTLTTTSDKTKLNVSPECPYYTQNQYIQATIVWEGDQVSGLLGPGDELYKKDDISATGPTGPTGGSTVPTP